MATLKYLSSEPNLQTVTLTSDYTAGDGHMHLTSGHGARLPATGDFWIRTPATGDVLNIFKVTARSTDDLTVSCVTGYGADANRAAGTVFSWSVTGEALDQFRSDLVQTGLDASKANEKAGNLYLPSDGMYIRRDTGAAWGQWGPIFPCTEPILADWTWVNQDDATAVNTYGGIYMVAPAASGIQFRILKKAAPATPWTLTVGATLNMMNVQYPMFQLFFRQSSDGKLVSLAYYTDNAGLFWATNAYNDADGAGASNYTYGASHSQSSIWLRISDNGVNRISAVSYDGITFATVHTVGRTDFLTADELGFGITSRNATFPLAAWIFHLSIT